MDIVVTIPKSEAANTAKEDRWVVANQAEGVVQFWSLGRKPKDLNIGDRVYFVERGRITCYQEFFGFASDPVCQVTGRLWPGLNLLLRCPAVPVRNYISYKGFRGFRYIERIE